MTDDFDHLLKDALADPPRSIDDGFVVGSGKRVAILALIDRESRVATRRGRRDLAVSAGLVTACFLLAAASDSEALIGGIIVALSASCWMFCHDWADVDASISG